MTSEEKRLAEMRGSNLLALEIPGYVPRSSWGQKINRIFAMNNLFPNIFKEGIVAGLITVIVFPFIFIWGLITTLIFPMLVLIYTFFIFMYLIANAIAPKFIEGLYTWVRTPLVLLGDVASFKPHFKKERENKQWIRSLNKKGVATPKTKVWRDGQISNEFRRFCSIILWLFNCKELRPHFILFLARVERMIQKNGSTYTFSYLKECMRILVRALAGTPHYKGKVSGTWIFIRLDHYGMPTIFPLDLRKCLREYIDYCNRPRGETFEMKDMEQDEFHPNKWNEAPLPYHTKKITAVLSLASIFRVLSTKVKSDLSTIIGPFTGKYSTLPKLVITQALRELTIEKTKGNGRFDFDTGTMVYQEVVKNNGNIHGIVRTGKFNPHFSPKAGPNGNMATWTAALDALAFMHEPLKALKLLGWMYDQRAFAYMLWFVCLNLGFGVPYIIWFHILKAHSKFLGLFRFLPTSFYYAWERSFGRIFNFWRLDAHTSHGLDSDRLYLGKLGVVYDQAGKARIVASTNWWIQSAFHGLHDSLFEALKCIPYDGTFDQISALDKVVAKKASNHKLSGFDLSPATDRLPINLQVDILNALGVDGQTWKELLDIEWNANSLDDPGYSTVRYAVGQPMGAYSSWAMLALTHHVIVYASYALAGVDFKEANYAVLGDDMVVNHDEVGLMYVRIMGSLGLTIKDGKSVISHRFTEFAKNLRGPGVNFTPVGAGAILAACRSGYMFPALIKSAMYTAITSTQDLLDLVERVPSGLVAKRDLKKFVNLVLWQFFGPKGVSQVSPVHFGSMLLEWISGLPKTSSMLVEHIYDSIGNVSFKKAYGPIKSCSHLPMANLLLAFATVNVMKVPFLRVLETLTMIVNPGFWMYFRKAILVEADFWEIWEKMYQGIPRVAEEGYIGTCIKLRYRINHIPELSLVSIPLTKAETKLRATFLRDILEDMNRRYKLSEEHTLHRNWYELDAHYR